MNIQLRKAKIEDYEALCDIYWELDTLHIENHPELFVKPKDYPRAKKYIAEIIQDQDQALIVATKDSMIVGFVESHVLKSSSFPVFKKREWVQINSLVVKKEYQGNQIGSLLLQEVSKWTKGKNINRIELDVYTFNQKALEFYLKNGFKEISKQLYLEL
ncbi:MAG: GNAT family N-acetyltransferase [Desulfitobacterium sp.]|nr:GNAT family N-acetyltransferase [Desulfitobacterium sp.]